MIRVKVQDQSKVLIKPQIQPKIQINIKDQILPVGDYESYEGEYEVTPKAFQSQELKTKGLVLNDNIVVKEIPYAEVTNLSGGFTVTIG